MFDVTLRSFQQMLRERAANELCLCYRKIVRRAAKQGAVLCGSVLCVCPRVNGDDDEPVAPTQARQGRTRLNKGGKKTTNDAVEEQSVFCLLFFAFCDTGVSRFPTIVHAVSPVNIVSVCPSPPCLVLLRFLLCPPVPVLHPQGTRCLRF